MTARALIREEDLRRILRTSKEEGVPVHIRIVRATGDVLISSAPSEDVLDAASDNPWLPPSSDLQRSESNDEA